MKFRTFVFKHIFSSRLASKLSIEAANNIAIVTLHGVHNDEMERHSKPPNSSIHVDNLCKNLKALRRNYEIISLDDAVELLNGGMKWKKRCVVLTFDDSLKCQARITGPILSDLKLTATFFISTEAIETQMPYWWRRLEYLSTWATDKKTTIILYNGQKYLLDATSATHTLSNLKKTLKRLSEKQRNKIVNDIESQVGFSILNSKNVDPFSEILDWEDVSRLQELGMTIGSHTVTHANLALLSGDELRFELETSKDVIEKRCGITCDHFSFPYGYYSTESQKAVYACGYKSALTTQTPGWNMRGTDLYGLSRFNMPHEAYKLAFVLSGWHDKIEQLRKLML